MKRYNDYTGVRFGHFVVVEKVKNKNDRNAKWLCRCDCGKDFEVYGQDLKRRKRKCCGSKCIYKNDNNNHKYYDYKIELLPRYVHKDSGIVNDGAYYKAYIGGMYVGCFDSYNEAAKYREKMIEEYGIKYYEDRGDFDYGNNTF